MSAFSARRLLFLVHQYTGFICAAYLIVVCTSGTALLLLENQIEGYRDYLMVRVPVRTGTLSLADIASIAQRANPGKRVRHILLSCPSGCTYDVSFDEGSNRRDVLVDPSTGEILKTLVWEHTTIGTLYRLHGSLFAGDAGEAINAAAGLSLIVLGCTGIYLWPRRIRLRFNALDLHRAVGIFAVAFLVMWSVTAAAQVFLPDTDEPIAPVAATGGELPLDRLVAIGNAALPGELTFVYPPSRGTVVVRKRVPGDPDQYGYSYVAVDAHTGRVAQVYDARSFPLSWRIREAMYSVHTGAPGGPVLRALYAVFGLAPAMLFATAFLMWLRKLKRSEQLAARAPLS